MTGSVAVLGIFNDSPTQMLLKALAEERLAIVLLDQRCFVNLPLHLTIGKGTSLGWMVNEKGGTVDLDSLAGLYVRPMDGMRLWSGSVTQGVACHAWTQEWIDIAERLPGRVANRASAMASNGSKPYQSRQLAAIGFAVPPMLLSNDPQAVLDFEDEHGPLIFKSASGVRSIVRPLDFPAKSRLGAIRHCPTLFQKRLQGTNVRVHVVGSHTFCTEIDSDGLDYRYAVADDHPTTLRSTTLDVITRWRCVAAADAMGLPFAGLDLMLSDDGATYCFEVNPSPGFSWYEDATGQPIARTLARWLAGID